MITSSRQVIKLRERYPTEINVTDYNGITKKSEIEEHGGVSREYHKSKTGNIIHNAVNSYFEPTNGHTEYKIETCTDKNGDTVEYEYDTYSKLPKKVTLHLFSAHLPF